MPTFLVYLPQPVQKDRTALLREVGLECLTGPNCHTVEHKDVFEAEAPDGKAGILFRIFDGRNPQKSPPFKFLPDAQDWIQAQPDPLRDLAAGRYWLGRMRDQPIRPEDLARPHQYDGREVFLQDGQPWRMPIARRLPANLQLDGTGQWSRQVKPEMREYFDESEALFAVQMDLAPYNLAYAIQFALRGLAMNYHLNAEIASWLNLLDEPHVIELVAAALEDDQIQAIRAAYLAFAEAERQKKTAEEPEASIPETIRDS